MKLETTALVQQPLRAASRMSRPRLHVEKSRGQPAATREPVIYPANADPRVWRVARVDRFEWLSKGPGKVFLERSQILSSTEQLPSNPVQAYKRQPLFLASGRCQAEAAL